MILNHSRYHQADLTVPWIFQSMEIVVPFPEVKDPNLITAIIRPFQPMVEDYFVIPFHQLCLYIGTLQVWLYVGLSLVVLSFTLTYVSGFYDKYINNIHRNQSPRGVATPMLTLGSFGINAMAVVSHLTNHSCKL